MFQKKIVEKVEAYLFCTIFLFNVVPFMR